MLVNNFKPLLFFGNNGTMKNVLGNDISLSADAQYGDYFLSSAVSWSPKNSHTFFNIGRSFNYTATDASNTYTDEQTTYNWANVVSAIASDSTPAFRTNGFTMFVGTGDTAVTADDYKLDTPVTLDVLSASCTQKVNGIVEVTRTFQNNTGNDVVIKEKGVYVFRTGYTYGSTAFDQPVVMIGRKVLDTPVTIPNGGAYTFTTTIDMSQITFAEADS